eukprot:8842095-Pyramimonas_sp.AAC.1
MAQVGYGTRAYGASPTELTAIRRKCAKGLRKAWPGRCLTTLLDLEGADPGITIPKNQIQA